MATDLYADRLRCRSSGGPGSAEADAAPAPAAEQSATAQSLMNKPWTGDFDGMVKRRSIRILTPYSKTHYFIDKGVQRGIVYDAGIKLEQAINKQLKTTPATKVHVVFVPTSRDALYQALIDGRGDIIAASVVITPERAKLVDFTIPGRSNINQIVVTGPGAPAIATVDDLSGKQIAVRDKGIQFETLTAMNAQLKPKGKAPIDIKTVPMSLEDEDILEMVSSGLLKATVVDGMIGAVLEADPAGPHRSFRRGRPRGWRGCLGGAQEQPEAARGAEPHRRKPTRPGHSSATSFCAGI